jgi:type IV pilus assembly protein PilV
MPEFMSKPQKGIVLLEALIAILIFAFGVLALVGLQANSINQVLDAKYRADASFVANEIIGKMWVNRASLSAFECDPCTSSSSNADIKAWVAQMAPGGNFPLPSAQASIVREAGAGNPMRVTVRWTPPQTNATHNHVAITYINEP